MASVKTRLKRRMAHTELGRSIGLNLRRVARIFAEKRVAEWRASYPNIAMFWQNDGDVLNRMRIDPKSLAKKRITPRHFIYHGSTAITISSEQRVNLNNLPKDHEKPD